MHAKLIYTQRRKLLTTNWFEPSSEQVKYIAKEYKDLTSELPFPLTYYEKTLIREGTYKRILDFLSEASRPGTLLYERTKYNNENGIEELYYVEYNVGI